MSFRSKPAGRAFAVMALIGALAAAPPVHAAKGGEPAAERVRAVLIGKARTYRTVAGDTLHDIARRFDLGFVELRAANPGVDPWTPPEGTVLALPMVHLVPAAPRRGIVVNRADQRLYVFRDDGTIAASFPVGIGREGWETPLGRMTIAGKKYRPTWTVPASIRAERPFLPARILPGPDNPLGEYALYLPEKEIVIHGTNAPDGIGRRVSHGCIRMYPEDVKRLFGMVEAGTEVRIVDQPVKVGWVGDDLLLEVHPSVAEMDLVEAGRPLPPARLGDALAAIRYVAGGAQGIDFERVVAIVRARRGMPERIAASRASKTEAVSDRRGGGSGSVSVR